MSKLVHNDDSRRFSHLFLATGLLHNHKLDSYFFSRPFINSTVYKGLFVTITPLNLSRL